MNIFARSRSSYSSALSLASVLAALVDANRSVRNVVRASAISSAAPTPWPATSPTKLSMPSPERGK